MGFVNQVSLCAQVALQIANAYECKLTNIAREQIFITGMIVHMGLQVSYSRERFTA